MPQPYSCVLCVMQTFCRSSDLCFLCVFTRPASCLLRISPMTGFHQRIQIKHLQRRYRMGFTPISLVHMYRFYHGTSTKSFNCSETTSVDLCPCTHNKLCRIFTGLLIKSSCLLHPSSHLALLYIRKNTLSNTAAIFSVCPFPSLLPCSRISNMVNLTQILRRCSLWQALPLKILIKSIQMDSYR